MEYSILVPFLGLRMSFVAKLGAETQDKSHLIVPKQDNEKIRHLKGKQVKLILEDEL